MTSEDCPNCGAELPPKASACPECGACEETGWSEDAYLDRLGVPSENFDYDEFVERELGGAKAGGRGSNAKTAVVWAVAALLIAALVFLSLRW